MHVISERILSLIKLHVNVHIMKHGPVFSRSSGAQRIILFARGEGGGVDAYIRKCHYVNLTIVISLNL